MTIPHIPQDKRTAGYWADWLRISARNTHRAGQSFVRLSVEEAQWIAAAIERDRKEAPHGVPGN